MSQPDCSTGFTGIRIAVLIGQNLLNGIRTMPLVGDDQIGQFVVDLMAVLAEQPSYDQGEL